MESIDVERWLVTFKVNGIPAFMDIDVQSPEVGKSGSIIGSLKHEVVDEWGLVDQIVNKDADF